MLKYCIVIGNTRFKKRISLIGLVEVVEKSIARFDPNKQTERQTRKQVKKNVVKREKYAEIVSSIIKKVSFRHRILFFDTVELLAQMR